jgi:hypothetical protein
VKSESEGMVVVGSSGEGMVKEESLRREARRKRLSGWEMFSPRFIRREWSF